MRREREASRAPPVRAALTLAASAGARRADSFSPAGLQRRFGNQGAQLVLRAVAGRNAEQAQRPVTEGRRGDPKRVAPAPAGEPPAPGAAPPADAGHAIMGAKAPAPEVATPAAKGGDPAARGATPAPSAEPAETAAAPSPAEAVAPVATQVRARARKARAHGTAGPAAAMAQAAGRNPAIERMRGAAQATVIAIATAETKPVESFRDKLKKALQAALPKPTNAEAAKRAMNHGADDANAALASELGTQTDETTGGLPAAADPKSEVRADKLPGLPAVELVPEAAGPAPAPVAAGPAVPQSAPPPDLSGDRTETDRAMADAGVTKQQMARSNEPDFTATLQQRENAEREEAQRAQQFEAGQSGILTGQHGQTAAMLSGGLATIHGSRDAGLGTVAGAQAATKSAEAKERERVTGLVEGIKNKTRQDVLQILTDMEASAKTCFAGGLALAEKAYEASFEEHKGGAWNWLTNWGDDWEELIETAFVVGRREYDRIVSQTIDDVAYVIENRLALAKMRVERGRKEVDDLVNGLTGESRRYGDEARLAIGSEFDAMDGEIDARRDAMVTQLVDQYRESQKRVAALEEKLRAENKSLWQRIYDATVGIIKKIIAFKDFLLDVLARAAQVVSAIIDDPIGFLGNLINGIMAGLEGFMARIGGYLKKGLLDWLFGAIEGAGIKLPETFDLKGIVDLVLQVLGLTWENIRARAVKVLGADTVAYLEKGWEIFQVLVNEGPAGLWKMLVEKIGDIKEMILTQVGDWVKEKIIFAGIKWVLSLLNPAAAFIKACMAIYDIVKFFVERAAQIASLINAILDTLGAIVRGNLTAMAQAVEDALARLVPVAIGFLASLLNLGGISDKIRNVIAQLRAPVNAAIDWIIGKAAGLVKKGIAFLSGKADAAINKVIRKTDKRTPEEKQRDLDRAAASLRPIVNALLKRGITAKQLKPLLLAWRLRYRLTSLTLENGKIIAAINPRVVLAEGWEFEDAEVFKVIENIAGDLIADAMPEVEAAPHENVTMEVQKPWGDRKASSQQVEKLDLTASSKIGRGAAALLDQKARGKARAEIAMSKDSNGAPLAFGHSPEQAPYGGWLGWQGIGPGGIGPKGRKYDQLRDLLKGKPVGQWLDAMMRNQPLPPDAQPHQNELVELCGLLMAKEPSHRPRDLVYSVMAIDMMQGPAGMSIEEVVGPDSIHPAAFGKAQMGARGINEEMAGVKRRMTSKRRESIKERRRRETATLQLWFKKHAAELQKPLLGHKPTLEDVEAFVRKIIHAYLAGKVPAAEPAPDLPAEEVEPA